MNGETIKIKTQLHRTLILIIGCLILSWQESGRIKKIEVGRNAEWIMKYLQIPVETYCELAREMNPEKFDAVKWVEMAKQTGMKYIEITAKHHDGFAKYNS